MTIDTKELRKRLFYRVDLTLEVQTIEELLDRLEAAEKERDAARMLADRLALALNTSNHERDAAELMSLALRAKIEAMGKQEPVAWMLNCPTLGGDTGWILSWTQSGAGLCNRLQGEENEKMLYALPGAQPAPSVPTDVITDYLVSISAHLAHQDDRKAQAEIGELLKMLAEAPEAKP